MTDPRKNRILDSLLADSAWANKSDDDILREVERRYAVPEPVASDTTSPRPTGPGRRFAREFRPIDRPEPPLIADAFHPRAGFRQPEGDPLVAELQRLANQDIAPRSSVGSAMAPTDATRAIPQAPPTEADFSEQQRTRLIGRARNRARDIAAEAAPRLSPEADRLGAMAENLETLRDREADRATVTDIAADRWRQEYSLAHDLLAMSGQVPGMLPAGMNVGESARTDVEQARRRGDIPTGQDFAQYGLSVDEQPSPVTALLGGAEPKARTIATEKPTDALAELGGTALADLPLFLAGGMVGRGVAGVAAQDAALARGAPAVSRALARYAAGEAPLIGGAVERPWWQTSLIRGAQEGAGTGAALDYGVARQEGASRGEAALTAGAGLAANVVVGAPLELVVDASTRLMGNVAKRIWARAPEGSRWNDLRDFVLGADEDIRQAMTEERGVPPTEPEVQQVKSDLASVVDATSRETPEYNAAMDYAANESRTNPEAVKRAFDGSIVERRKVNGQDVYVVGREGHSFGADAGTQVKNAVRAVDLDATPGRPEDALAGFRGANGYDRVNAAGESRGASKVEDSRFKQAINGIVQRAARLGRTITPERAMGFLAAIKPTKPLALAAAGAGAELAAERTDNPKLKAGLRVAAGAALGAAVGHATGYSKAWREAAIDPLTNLHGQRSFLKAKQKPGGYWLSLDLDGFKPVNDKLGHSVGDEVLRVFGRDLRRATEGTGVRGEAAYRSGGDEAAVRFETEAQARQALEVMSRWRHKVGDHEVTVTGSIGRTYDEADQALLPRKQAKRRRRGDVRGEPTGPAERPEGPARAPRTAEQMHAEAAAESPEDVRAGKLPGNYPRRRGPGARDLALVGAAVAGQFSDDDRTKALAAAPLVFTHPEYGDIEVHPGKLIEVNGKPLSFASGPEAGAFIKDVVAAGGRAVPQHDRATGTFNVLAKGANTALAKVPVEPTAVAKVEPFDPSLPMERNRPRPGTPGRALRPDPQGRWVSRVGQALEDADANLKMTIPEWQKWLLGKADVASKTEVNALFNHLQRPEPMSVTRERLTKAGAAKMQEAVGPLVVDQPTEVPGTNWTVTDTGDRFQYHRNGQPEDEWQNYYYNPGTPGERERALARVYGEIHDDQPQTPLAPTYPHDRTAKLDSGEVLNLLEGSQFKVETVRQQRSKLPKAEQVAQAPSYSGWTEFTRMLENPDLIAARDPARFGFDRALADNPESHPDFEAPDDFDSDAAADDARRTLGNYNLDDDFPDQFGGRHTGRAIRNDIVDEIVTNDGDLSERQVEELSMRAMDAAMDAAEDFTPLGSYASTAADVSDPYKTEDGWSIDDDFTYDNEAEARAAQLNAVAKYYGYRDDIVSEPVFVPPERHPDQLVVDPEHPEIQAGYEWQGKITIDDEDFEFSGPTRESVVDQARAAIDEYDWYGSALYEDIRSRAEEDLPDFRGAIEEAAQGYRDAFENSGDADQYREDFLVDKGLDDIRHTRYGLTNSDGVMTRSAEAYEDIDFPEVHSLSDAEEAAREAAYNRPRGTPMYVKLDQVWTYVTPEQGAILKYYKEQGHNPNATFRELMARETAVPGITADLAARLAEGEDLGELNRLRLRGQRRPEAEALPEDTGPRFLPEATVKDVPQFRQYGGENVRDYRTLVTVLTNNPLEADAAKGKKFVDTQHGFPQGVQHMARMGEFNVDENGELIPSSTGDHGTKHGDLVTMLVEGQSDHINDAGEDKEYSISGRFFRHAPGFREVGSELNSQRPREILAPGTPPGADFGGASMRIRQQSRNRIAAAEEESFKVLRRGARSFREWAEKNLGWKLDRGHRAHSLRDFAQFANAQRRKQARSEWLKTPEGQRLAAQFAKQQDIMRLAYEESDRATNPDQLYVKNPKGEPASPFTDLRATARLNIQRLLTEMAETGGKYFAWSASQDIIPRYNDEYAGLYRLLYDELMPSELASQMRWLGYKNEEIPQLRRFTGQASGNGLANRFQGKAPDDLAQRIFRRGFPLLGIAGISFADAMDAEAQSGPGGAEQGMSLGTKVAIGAAGAGALLLGGKAVKRLLTRGGKAALKAGEEGLTHGALSEAAKAAAGKVPATLKRRGPLPNLTANEVDRLNLPPDLADAVRSRMQTEVEKGVPPVETFDEARAKAASLMGVAGERLADLDPKRVTGPEVLAIASLARERIERSSALAQRLADPSLPMESRAKLREEMEDHDAKALMLMGAAMRGSSEQGRALNANKILANLTNDPLVWAMRAQRAMGDVPLRPDQMAEIRRHAADPDKTALLKYIAGLQKTPVPQQIVTLLNAGLFTRPAARVLDLVGGVGNVMVEQGALSYPRAVLDWLIGRTITGQRTATAMRPADVAQMARGAGNGLREAAQLMGIPDLMQGGPKAWVEAIRSANVTPEMLARYDIPRMTTIDFLSATRNPNTPANKVVDVAQKAVYRSLGVADRVVHGAAYRGALADAARAQAVTEGHPNVRQRVRELLAHPDDELVAQAMHMADQMTFQNDDATAQVTREIMAGPGRAVRRSPAGHTAADLTDAAMRFQFPVARTVANIGAKVADYTAIGALSGIWNVARAAGKARVGDMAGSAAAQRRAVEVLARFGTGTALLATGAYLAEQGLMTGAAPVTGSEREQWRVQNKTPNSMLIDGEWVPIGRLPPGGTVLALGATLHEMQSKGKATGLGGQAMGAARTIIDQPLVTGTRSALDAIRDPIGQGERYGEMQAGRVVPTALAIALQNAAGGARRDPDGPVEAVQARLDPEGSMGLWDRIPAQRDALGEEVRGNTSLINPFRGPVDRTATDPIVGETARAGWVPSGTKRNPDESNTDYEGRMMMQGAEVRRALTATVNSPTYQQAEQVATRLLQNPSGLAKLAAKYDVPTPTTVPEVARLIRRDLLQQAEQTARGVARSVLADSLRALAQP